MIHLIRSCLARNKWENRTRGVHHLSASTESDGPTCRISSPASLNQHSLDTYPSSFSFGPICIDRSRDFGLGVMVTSSSAVVEHGNASLSSHDVSKDLGVGSHFMPLTCPRSCPKPYWVIVKIY